MVACNWRQLCADFCAPRVHRREREGGHDGKSDVVMEGKLRRLSLDALRKDEDNDHERFMSGADKH